MRGGARVQLTRRELLILVAGCGIGAALPDTLRLLGAPADLLDIDLPAADGLDSPTREIFSALSCIVTTRTQMHPPSVERVYSVFMAEPWGSQHILGAYRALRISLTNHRQGDLIADLSSHGLLSDGERWFCGHLLETWYTGIYFHSERKTQRVLHEDSLMWDSSRNFVPIYFRSSLPYGSWTKAPE